MKLSQRLVSAKEKNIALAVESHLGFLTYVRGQVKKIGIETVLKQSKDDKFYWLKKAYERFLTFAEECQYKMIPLEHIGQGPEGEILIKVERANIQDGDNLQAPRFAIPDLSGRN